MPRCAGPVVRGLQHIARRAAGDGQEAQERGRLVQQRPRRPGVELHGPGAQQAKGRRCAGPGHPVRVRPGQVMAIRREQALDRLTTATFTSRPLPLHGSTARAFSADTGMAECLVVATKRGGGKSSAAYSNLSARPSSTPGSRRGSEGRKGPGRAGRNILDAGAAGVRSS